MALNFMSNQEFEGGGPGGNAAATTGGGLGQLASVIAQGPRLQAQADHARAETENLRQTGRITGDRAARATRAIDLMKDVNTAKNPQAMAELTALVGADPQLTQHLGSVIGAVMGQAAMNGGAGAPTRANVDAYVAGQPGGPAYGNTSTGATAALGNQRAITGMQVAGQEKVAGMQIAGHQNLQDTQSVQAIPPGMGYDPRNAKTMTRKQANESGARVLSDAESVQLMNPKTTVPADAKPGTRGTEGPLADVYAQPPGARSPTSPAEYEKGNESVQVVPAGSASNVVPTSITAAQLARDPPGTWTVIGAAQQQAQAKGTTKLTPQGVVGTTEGDLSNNQTPVIGTTEGVTAANQQLAGTGAGPRAGPTSVGPEAVNPDTGMPDRLAQLYAQRPPQQYTPPTIQPKETKYYENMVDEAAAKHFPPNIWGRNMGADGASWGPKARAAIIERVDQITKTDRSYAKEPAAAVEVAIRQLQDEGRLDKDSEVTPGFFSKNIVELKDTDSRAGPRVGGPRASRSQTQTKTATAETPTQVMQDSTGKRVGQFPDGKWHYLGPKGERLTPYVAGKPTVGG